MKYIVTTKFPLWIAKTKPKPKDIALVILGHMREEYPGYESKMVECESQEVVS